MKVYDSVTLKNSKSTTFKQPRPIQCAAFLDENTIILGLSHAPMVSVDINNGGIKATFGECVLPAGVCVYGVNTHEGVQRSPASYGSPWSGMWIV